MTFAEATTKIENIVGDLNIRLGVENALLDVIEKLQKQYAPTVKMTTHQKTALLMMKDDNENFIDVLLDTDTEEIRPVLDPFWLDLTNEELMQAWLHPDSIEIID